MAVNDKNISEYQEAMQELHETLAEVSKATFGANENIKEALLKLNESMQPIIARQEDMLSGIRDAISVFQASLPKIENEELKLYANNIRFLRFLENIKWPLFLERNKTLQESLSQYYIETGDYDYDGIRDTIFEYYSDDKIEDICELWKEILQDDVMRFDILKQAIILHREEKYYASTALLMSQVDGIITKADNFIKDRSYKVNEDTIKALCKRYKYEYPNWKKNSNDHERAQMLKLMAITEEGLIYWDAITKYIIDIVLKRNGDDDIAAYNPMRNKILHGVQLNYGTKEHSLKAILTVDLLIQYYTEIASIIDSDDEEE